MPDVGAIDYLQQRRETLTSWVTMVGRVSELRVESVLSRLQTDDELVDALTAILASQTSAWGQFDALRNYLVGELCVESNKPVVPIIERHPSPWDVPANLRSKIFGRRPPTIRQYFDSIEIHNHHSADPGAHAPGRTTRLFTNTNLGRLDRTNLHVGRQLSPKCVLLTSWWILIPGATASIDNLLSKTSISFAVNNVPKSCLNAFALLTPRPLFVPYPERSDFRVDLETRTPATVEAPTLLFVYFEGWEATE